MEIVEEGAEDLAAGAAGADPVLALTAEGVAALVGVIVVEVVLEEAAEAEATVAAATGAVAAAAAALTNQEKV